MPIEEISGPSGPAHAPGARTARATPDEQAGSGTSYQAKMWLGVGCALAATIGGLFVFVGTNVSRIAEMTSAHAGGDLQFGFSGMLLIMLTLLRLLAMLIGAGMVFGGLAVSFHTHAQATQLMAQHGELGNASLATSSPGIAAIVIGAVVILSALFHRGEYKYEPAVYGRIVQIGGNAPSDPASAPRGAQADAAIEQLPPSSEVLARSRKKEGQR